MTNKESVYNANSIEKYWQKVWDKKCFQTKDTVKDKNYYVLEMFPILLEDSYGTCKSLYTWRCAC